MTLNNTQTVRTHGLPPCRAVLLHGGPGIRGDMLSVARVLAAHTGVAEHLQRASTIAGQVEELRRIVMERTESPVALIGHSWGAWLGWIFAAAHPALVNRLVLVSSGPFEERYARDIQKTRISRLEAKEREAFMKLSQSLDRPAADNSDRVLRECGMMLSRADAYDPLPGDGVEAEPDFNVFHGVMNQALALRRSGALLARAGRITCPVTAIHGDYDPHPAAGVREPLARVLKNFRFFLLEKCGHYPWKEKHARDVFYKLLKEECR